MPSLIERWSECMAALGWVHNVDNEDGLITFTSNSGQASLRASIKFDEEKQEAVLVIPLERKCESKFMTTMAMLCNSCNRNVTMGLFSVDLSDGLVRYRNSCDVKGVEINTIYVSRFLKASVGYVEKMYPAIQAGLNGFSVPYAEQKIDKS